MLPIAKKTYAFPTVKRELPSKALLGVGPPAKRGALAAVQPGGNAPALHSPVDLSRKHRAFMSPSPSSLNSPEPAV